MNPNQIYEYTEATLDNGNIYILTFSEIKLLLLICDNVSFSL